MSAAPVGMTGPARAGTRVRSRFGLQALVLAVNPRTVWVQLPRFPLPVELSRWGMEQEFREVRGLPAGGPARCR